MDHRHRAQDRSGRGAAQVAARDPSLFAHLVDLHVEDMGDVGKAPRTSKQFTLDALKAKLGKVRLKGPTPECLIQFGKGRTKEGAVPATLSAGFGHPKLVLAHAAAVHGVDVKAGPVDLARAALKRLGLVGKSRQRDRRPTRQEIKRLPEGSGYPASAAHNWDSLRAGCACAAAAGAATRIGLHHFRPTPIGRTCSVPCSKRASSGPSPRQAETPVFAETRHGRIQIPSVDVYGPYKARPPGGLCKSHLQHGHAYYGPRSSRCRGNALAGETIRALFYEQRRA